MSILVDTPVWSLALRRKPSALSPKEREIVDELKRIVRDGRTRMIGLIRQELLSGLRDGEQFEALRTDLRAFPDELLLAEDYEAAAEAHNACRARGVVVSTADILICAVSIRRGWEVFTTDRDFSHQAKVVSVKLHSLGD
jgi:hypothetical protein